MKEDLGNKDINSKAMEIGRFKKNLSEDVVVALHRYNGHELVDIRVHAIFGTLEERVPTKRGLSININKLPGLMEMLQKALEEAELLGMKTKMNSGEK